MTKGRNVPPRPDPKPGPTILALDPAMLEGEPWDRQAYVARNWQPIAAMAWQGYQALGRGMVRLTVNPASGRVNQPDGGSLRQCEYVPLALAVEYGCREQAKVFMWGYDPRTEIVIAFVDETPTPGNPGGTALMFQFRASGTLETPPEAYAARPSLTVE